VSYSWDSTFAIEKGCFVVASQAGKAPACAGLLRLRSRAGAPEGQAFGDPEDIVLTHLNLYDNTCEGLMHRRLPLFSVQYHPEASPGPHDASYLFRRFVEMMERERRATTSSPSVRSP
jgi:hypothetical protein